MAKKKFSEITIVRDVQVGSRTARVGMIIPVADLKEAEVKLLVNLGKARPTVPEDKNRKAAPTVLSAKELIEKIETAKSIEDLRNLVPEGEERSTVLAAANKKATELGAGDQ